MHLKQRIKALVELGNFLREMSRAEIDDFSTDEIENNILQTIRTTKAENGWFVVENIQYALRNWADALSEENLERWVSKYDFNEVEPKRIAIIMAGNIPLVGFHDFLSVLISGHKVLAKLSSNDKTLLPFIANHLISIEPEFKEFIAFTDGRITDFDGVIATGSNNTARYFDHYFQKYPHIIRKNRNSVAVLSNEQTQEDLERLSDDIFRYFGLGCRNVSKIYVPKNYDFTKFFEALYKWKEIIHNNKYINNYDYNKAVYLMDKLSLLDNEFVLLKEDQGFSSPIAVIFYEYYTSLEDLEKKLLEEDENIQAIISNTGITDEIDFGKSQSPQLWDYADGVDTLNFLLNIR